MCFSKAKTILKKISKYSNVKGKYLKLTIYYIKILNIGSLQISLMKYLIIIQLAFIFYSSLCFVIYL